ncbi:MAG TPA: hypothetical protein VGL48_18235 [Acidimicrobiales bacterium]|jgi:hypothetical protein
MAHVAPSDRLRSELEPGSPEEFARRYFEARDEELAKPVRRHYEREWPVVLSAIISGLVGTALLLLFVWATHPGRAPIHHPGTSSQVTTTTAPATVTPPPGSTTP